MRMNFLKEWIIQYQNKYSVGGVETTIERVTGTVSQEGDTISAAFLNEIQRNCIYQVNATRVIEGVLEIYDISIDGSDEFTPFNQIFLIEFDSTNTKVDSLLRFNGTTYSIRFSENVTTGDKAPGIATIPKRSLVKLDIANSKALLIAQKNLNENITNFASATGRVVIPSNLEIGTRRLIRKVNATQGTVTITCPGETFTPSNLTSVTLNADGDFWLLEKVTSTRWDLVDGKETLTTSEGNSIALHTGVLVFTGASEPYSGADVATHTFTWTFPKVFKAKPTVNSNYLTDVGQSYWSQLAIDSVSASTCTIKIAKLQISGTVSIFILCTGRWY